MINIDYELESKDSELVLTEDESDEIINNLKDELIKESILEQIKNPLNNSFGNNDYLDIFQVRYNYLSEIYKDSPVFIIKLDEVKNIMYSEIFNTIIKKFNLKFSDDLDIIQATEVLYEFFILDYRDNMIEYLISKIIKDKKSLVMSLSSPEFSNKIGFKSLKKVLKNKDDALIISNITHVINNILSTQDDNLEVINDICEDDIDEITNYRIHQYFLNDFSIAPNKDFCNLFFGIIKNKENGYSFIVNEVKIKLLNLATKK